MNVDGQFCEDEGCGCCLGDRIALLDARLSRALEQAELADQAVQAMDRMLAAGPPYGWPEEVLRLQRSQGYKDWETGRATG